MRILQLELERFGSFTGQTLTFEPSARLHVVHGPNEAGKSCALAALTDLLFGIDRKTPYDFRHDRKDLRVGASIQNTKGDTLAFRRRPGNKNTLLKPDSDSALPEDVLAGFIGAIDRPVFCNAFGLNAVTLRSGAEDMLRSEGDVGASLFAAASGLRGLADLRQKLETEAAAIFAARASQGRTFYQALERFEQARKAIRERELRDGPWKELIERIEDLSLHLDSLGETRRAYAEKRARLSRLKRVAPQIRLIDEEMAKLDALGPLPDALPGTADKLSHALERRNAAAEHLRRTGEDEQRALANHAEITVNETILARSDEVVTLFSELGAFAAARKDLPGVEREVAAFVKNLDGFAARLGFPDSSSLEDTQPTDAALALVRELISEGRQRGVALAGSEAELAAEMDVVANLEQQVAGLDKVVDPKPLQQQFAAIAPVLRQLERREEVAENLSNLSRQFRDLAGRLTPPVDDPQSLAAAPLPTAEPIARYRQLLDETNNKLVRVRDRLAESVDASSALERHIKDFETGTPIASTQEIAHRREERNALWSQLRSILFGGTDLLTGPSLMEAVSDFERLLAEADWMADAALLDSARSEAFSAARKQFLDEQTKTEGMRRSIQDLEENLAQDWSAYVALWQSAGIVPLPPADMAWWLESVDRLLTLREELEAARTTLEAIDAAVEGIVPTLVALTTQLGLDELKRLPPRLAAPALDARLREMADAWQGRRAFDASLTSARTRIERLERRRDEAAKQHANWQIRWQPAIAAVGLSDATMDQAQATLEVWQMVPGARAERDNRSRRVASMKRDIDSFAQRGAALIAELAPDLAALPPDDALRSLNETLAEATQGDSARAEAQKRVTEAAKASAEAHDELAAGNDALEMLTSLLPKDSDLAALCERLKRRDQLVESVAKMKAQLLSQGDGQDEATLRRELEGFEPDAAAARLKALETEDEQCESQTKEAFSERKRALDEKDALEKGVGAEIAWVTRRSAEAELAAAAREYSVLKLGALLLGAAIDRHRSDQQDPLMTRAGTLFAGLTGGSYSALGQAFDDEDVPRLIGTRPTGEQVHIAGMSDGARDQLYLALRLAYLEDYASRSEPIPFIGDDIFMTFDDARTKNGILALAAIGGKVQPILFTHHQYVVDLAHEALGDGANILKLGTSA